VKSWKEGAKWRIWTFKFLKLYLQIQAKKNFSFAFLEFMT